MDVRLEPMAAADFALRRLGLIQDSARALATHRGLSPAAARTVAEREIGERLRTGPATSGQVIRTAVAADGTQVGWIWISLPGFAVPGTAWLSDIVVDPAHRSRGYVRAIIAAAEVDLAARGVDRIGLNVYGDNHTAHHLYERAGRLTLDAGGGVRGADRFGLRGPALA